MKVLVNIFHPNLSAPTVNGVWVERLEGEPEVTIRKIYELYPDGKIDAVTEQETLLAYDRIAFQHPFCWHPTSSLMKQWLDQVFTYNWAYGPEGRALEGRERVSAIPTGGPAELYRAGGYNNFSMSELMKSLQQTANLVHLKLLLAFIFNGVVQATPADIEESAEKLAKHILDPLLSPGKRLAALNEKMDGEGVELHVD